jgi:OPT family oligopeptide transporter
MQYYPEVPMWWYGIIGIISFSFLCITIKIIPTQLPIWAIVVAILLSFLLSLPLSILMAISNQQIGTQVMFEFISGYMIPGRPIANMIFKTVGLMTNSQATEFAADLKLGHYMKVPPQAMFTIQIVSTVITCIWVTVIQDWMLNNIEDICTPRQKQGFICPGPTVFATASVIFGAVGPQRLFSPGAPYATYLTHLTFTPLTLMPPDTQLFFGSSPLGSLHPSLSTSWLAASLSPFGDTSTSQLSSVCLIVWLRFRGSTTVLA